METCEQDDGSSSSNNINEAILALKSSGLGEPKLGPSRTKRRFQRLGQVYSKAHGSYIAWRTDVNLDTPAALGRKVPTDAKHTTEYYSALQYTLFETGFPETIDRTDSPKSGETAEGVTVTVLSSPVECIGLLLEGGKQCPDAFVLILSASWIRKVPTSESSFDLYVYKGVTFARGGATYIDEYDPPRRCTYLLNFFTSFVTGGQRDDGTDIAKDLECPMSSSVELAAKVDDKVWTTTVMAEVGMKFPESLAFRFRPNRNVKVIEDKRIRIVDMDDRVKGVESIAEEVEHFLNQPFMQNIRKIVVKPSGPMFYGSIGVSIHPRDNHDDVINAVTNLLRDLEPGCSVLVQSFIEPLRARETGKTKTEFHSQLYGFRCRANVCRDFANKPKTMLVTCGVNRKDIPISGDNTVHQSLDSTLISFGVTDPVEREALLSNLTSKSEAVLQYIMDDEVLHQDNRRTRAMTDIIGIDLIITDDSEGSLSFVGIEVNSHDCIINCHVMEFVNSLVGREPESFQTTVQTMVTRSQKYLMEEKQVLIVGAGGFNKRHIYHDARQYGVKVILVDSDPDHTSTKNVHKFIHYDFTNHNLDLAHARNIVNLLRCEDIEVDGCVTFWEDCVPLASAVVELLDTNGNCFEASSNAKQKSRTQSILLKRGDDIPHWPRTCHYASGADTITCGDDLTDIEKRVNFPCMLKLEYGSSAVGVSLCHSGEGIASEYKLLREILTKEEDFPGIGLGFNNTMMVMAYLEGSEHDVDIAIYNRKFLTAVVTDNAPTNGKSFAETGACMPSRLPQDKQGQLVAAAYQCCTEIGLENGVFNVEMKMTACGPKLIEINARMGGFYIRDWIKRLYGFDIALVSLMISCDIKPLLFKPEVTETIMGVMLVPSNHKHVLKDAEKMELLRTMHKNKEIIFTEYTERYEEAANFYEEPVANVAVVGSTPEACKDKILELCRQFEISTEEYNVESFIESF